MNLKLLLHCTQRESRENKTLAADTTVFRKHKSLIMLSRLAQGVHTQSHKKTHFRSVHDVLNFSNHSLLLLLMYTEHRCYYIHSCLSFLLATPGVFRHFRIH